MDTDTPNTKLLVPVARHTRKQRPNPPFQPTPHSGDKIGRILESGFGSTGLPIYRCGAAEWQAVGPRPVIARTIRGLRNVLHFMHGIQAFSVLQV